MDEAWQILVAAGVPLQGAAHDDASPERIASAIETVLASALGEREREALAAFVLGMHHHWPTAFTSTFGDRAGAILRWADGAVADLNRHLKLRRIAIANIAARLAAA